VIDMLILNRKEGESIIIGDNVEIRILEVQDGKIKIGIDAPKEVSILRKEVYDSVIEENKNAITNDTDILKLFSQK
jgi:carbon storage regulator